jgi:hypothetical protein
MGIYTISVPGLKGCYTDGTSGRWVLWNMKIFIGFEDFKAGTMKNAVFWDVVPCRSCENQRFGGKYHLHGATSQKMAFFMKIFDYAYLSLFLWWGAGLMLLLFSISFSILVSGLYMSFPVSIVNFPVLSHLQNLISRCSYTDTSCPVGEVSSFYKSQQSRCLPSFHLKMQTDLVSKRLCSSEHQTMNEVQELNNSECYVQLDSNLRTDHLFSQLCIT